MILPILTNGVQFIRQFISSIGLSEARGVSKEITEVDSEKLQT